MEVTAMLELAGYLVGITNRMLCLEIHANELVDAVKQHIKPEEPEDYAMRCAKVAAFLGPQTWLMADV